MSEAREHPQIYLISPSEFEFSTFPAQLAACLDSTEVACVRLALGTTDETRIAKAADTLREVTHERDVALVIDSHIQLVDRLGLDGVHLNDGARSVRQVRKDLGADAIVGSLCTNSRHDGMTAGELGVDYVSFGPVGKTTLGDGRRAELALFEWWSMMIEVPVVAEGGLDAALIRSLSPHTDFFGIGDEIWAADNPAAVLGNLRRAMLG